MKTSRHILRVLQLCVLALAVISCESISRSGLRKLAEYNYHQFATLNPAAMRVAVERDSRIQVDLEGTSMLLYGSRGDKTYELARLSPSFRSESADVLPGLPRAVEGHAWSLLGISTEELPRAAEIQELIRLLSSPFYSPSKVGKQLEKMHANDGIRWAEKGEKQISFEFHLSFTQLPAESGSPLPASVWLLLDSKDGYFRLIDNAVWRNVP